MWALESLGAVFGVAIALTLFARSAERLLLVWYERETRRLDIPERIDEKIVTYPLA